MKKNIGFIPMDFVLEEWLLEKLIKEPPKSDCAEDLLSGIRDIAFVQLDERDVIRHPLVKDIIDAYKHLEQKNLE